MSEKNRELTRTELRYQYIERTSDIGFSEALDDILEEDYVINTSFYSDKVLFDIFMVELMMPDLPTNEILSYVKNEFYK
jgi:hypothetical protein